MSANFIPLLVMTIMIEKVQGEAQLGYFIFGFWGLISAFIYGFYFVIPELKRNLEKIISLFLPSIILSLALFEIPMFSIVVGLNLILNGIFVWHLKNKNMLLTLYKKT